MVVADSAFEPASGFEALSADGAVGPIGAVEGAVGLPARVDAACDCAFAPAGDFFRRFRETPNEVLLVVDLAFVRWLYARNERNGRKDQFGVKK